MKFLRNTFILTTLMFNSAELYCILNLPIRVKTALLESCNMNLAHYQRQEKTETGKPPL